MQLAGVDPGANRWEKVIDAVKPRITNHQLSWFVESVLYYIHKTHAHNTHIYKTHTHLTHTHTHNTHIQLYLLFYHKATVTSYDVIMSWCYIRINC